MKDLVLLSLPDWVDNNPTMYFPLSLLYLASSAREAGYDVEIVDCRTGMKKLPKAKYYGFSCATPQIRIAKEVAKTVKGRTIIGGPHASLLPHDCVNDFDYVVKGEGEFVLLDILAGIHLEGIIKADRIKNLDLLPFPAWDMVDKPFSKELFPGERYGSGKLAATIIGNRGCPYSCSFCGNVHKAPVVFRSVTNIIGELQELKKLGVRHFRFEDDCFTIHPEFEALCFEISKLDIRYKMHTRSNLITLEKAQRLRASGCEECGVGVESADDSVLGINAKGVNSVDHINAIKVIKEAGLRAKAYFVMGLPGETNHTLEANKAFVRATQIDKWTVSTFCPYPGCPVYGNPEKFGVIILNHDYEKWWNYCEEGYNHRLKYQTPTEMWTRYRNFYTWLASNIWKKSQ